MNLYMLNMHILPHNEGHDGLVLVLSNDDWHIKLGMWIE